MKTLTPLLLFVTALTAPFLSATREEFFYKAEYLGSSGWTVEIEQVYQTGSDVLVVYRDIPPDGGAFTVMTWFDDEAMVRAPELAARYVEFDELDFDPQSPVAGTPGVLLYNQGVQVAEYDPSLGSGWSEDGFLGRVFMRHYPWVYHPSLGWIYAETSTSLFFIFEERGLDRRDFEVGLNDGIWPLSFGAFVGRTYSSEASGELPYRYTRVYTYPPQPNISDQWTTPPGYWFYVTDKGKWFWTCRGAWPYAWSPDVELWVRLDIVASGSPALFAQ